MKKVLVLFVALFVTLTLFAQKAGSVQDQQACEYARRSSNAEIWQDYLKQFPQGMCAFEAKSEIKKLDKNNQNKIGELHWSNRSPHTMNWYAAAQYCRDLKEGGYGNWRLPNIDELRTLIQNHSGTQSGGSCPVSEKTGKLAGRDLTGDCLDRDGSNFSKLGDKVGLWSSSVIYDIPNIRWIVDFSSGLVGNNYIELTNYYYVRCVR